MRNSKVVMSKLVLIKEEKKFPIFDQNHGLTPSEKFEFFVYVKKQFYGLERLSFPLQTFGQSETS